MRFVFPINEPQEGGSVTCHVVSTDSDIARTNRKHLKMYLTKMGVPENEHKRVLKAMGFWGKGLGK